MSSEDFERGLRVRCEVLGDEFVDANLSGSDAFMMTFQHLVTEFAWGQAWSGTALDRKSKALVTLGILAALGRSDELAIYVRGALTSGATVSEIEEVLVHVTAYCGTRPAARPSWPFMRRSSLQGRFPPCSSPGWISRLASDPAG